MNCLEFRRVCLSEPGSRSQSYIAHRGECQDCARYAESVVELDRKIEQALQVPVPEDLANRIRLRQLIQDEHVTRRLRPWQYALAASVLVVVALSGALGYQIYSSNRYMDHLVVAAVDHTRLARQGNHFVGDYNDPVMQERRFKQVLAAFGGKVMDDAVTALGPIVHVQVCPMAGVGSPVVHVVILGDAGLVTLYYVPGHRLRRSLTFERDHYKGMLVPIGRGNVAIVGDPAESLDAVANKLEQAVAWRT